MKQKRMTIIVIMVIAVVTIIVLMDWKVFFPEKPLRQLGNKVEVEIGKNRESLPHTKQAMTLKPTPSLQGQKLTYAGKSYIQLQHEVVDFFSILDNKSYIKAYALRGGSYAHFLELISRLRANPPVISGETKDMYTLMHNMAHFYRVLGSRNVHMIKDILFHERADIESDMALFYEWFKKASGNKDADIIILPNDLYEYASFFLGTLGGKSYLSRRSSRIRTLVTYYSVMIIHKADIERKNRYGIDIRPYVANLIDDVRSRKDLVYAKKYLANLKGVSP